MQHPGMFLLDAGELLFCRDSALPDLQICDGQRYEDASRSAEQQQTSLGAP
ncbi:MAG: hypothetical protein K0Q81_2100 [Paenibacillus sp.]|nr:hypothetical protein [Paenibacillus sp.]